MSTRKALLLAALFGILAIPAQALSPRVFISPSGNNSADCANALTPCLTFVGALLQVSPGGEIIALATGGYGPLNITFAVTISGPNGVVLYSHAAVGVNAAGAKVVLRGLTIDGAPGDGITISAAGSVFVENCVINASTGNGIAVGAGVTTDLIVQESTIRNNTGHGILVAGTAGGLTVNRCHIEGNGGDGIQIQAGKASIRQSAMEKNTNDGVQVKTAGTIATLEKCLLARNGNNGLEVTTSAVGRITDSTVTGNATGLANGGGTLTTRGNNTVIDNTTNTSGSITNYLPI